MALAFAMRKMEEAFEHVVFAIRWMLVPGYIILCICLVLTAYKIGQNLFHFISVINSIDETQTIVHVLSIVDLVLVTNLVLMVIFVGYVHFVSKIHLGKNEEDDRPVWMDTLDYSGLKIQMIGSIIAISSVKLLGIYMYVGEGGEIDREQIMWLIAIHGTFVVSILFLSIVNKLKPMHESSTGVTRR